MTIQDGIIHWFNGPDWDEVAEDAFKDSAQQVQSYAQDNAPWEDRTGDARSGLTTEVNNEDGVIILTLFHTVEYGIWLETIQNGNFAVIMPTLESQGPAILRETEARIAQARSGDDF